MTDSSRLYHDHLDWQTCESCKMYDANLKRNVCLCCTLGGTENPQVRLYQKTNQTLPTTDK